MGLPETFLRGHEYSYCIPPDSDWWDVDTSRYLTEDNNFPFLQFADLERMSSNYEEDFTVFQFQGQIMAMDWETCNIYYLGDTIDEVELWYQVIKLNGWKYSVFPRVDDDTGEILGAVSDQ